MMHSNKRKLNLLLFLAACVFVSIAATKPSVTKPVATQHNLNDTGIFKNLKVLPKDISKEKLDTIMHHFTAALGVKCNFCHVRDEAKRSMDFASDDKEEKEIARYMLNMTAGINEKYFNHENSTRPDTISVVKCVTCHHGNPHPDEAAMAMPMDNHNMPPPPSPNDSSSKLPSPPPNQ